MRRYEVLFDNVPAGFVEALDPTQAMGVAYKDPAFAGQVASRLALSLRRDYGYGMFILIDTTNWKALARHDSNKALAALALIQFNNVDTAIIRTGENRNFSVFDGKQVIQIAASIGLTLPAGSYATQLKALRAALETIEWLALPYTTEQLVAQAYEIKPTYDHPLAFNPEGDQPKPMKKWHVEPQRNRARQDSAHWHMFAAGLGYGPGVTSPAALAHLQGLAAPEGEQGARKRPPSPSRARSGAPAAPKPPKPPRAPGAPATRPKAGTSTGKVWELADELWDAGGSAQEPKAFKAAVVAACTAAGINAGTVNVQFSKWRSSKAI